MRFPISELKIAAPFTDLEYTYSGTGMDNMVEAVIFVNAIQGCEYISDKDMVVLGDNEWYRTPEGEDILRSKAKKVKMAGLIFYSTSIEDIPESILLIGREFDIPVFVAGDVSRGYSYSEISDYFNENYYIQTS